MNRKSFFAWLLVAALSAGFVVGCGGDDDDDDNNPTGPSNGDLPWADIDDLSDAEVQMAVESGMLDIGQQSIQQVQGLRQSFINGVFMAPDMANDGLMKEFATISEPPEGWTGPDENGWYSNNFMGENYDYMARMTPDIWADDYDGSPLTKIEYRMVITTSEGGSTVQMDSYYWGQTNQARTLFNGEMDYDIVMTIDDGQGGTQEWEYGFGSTWDNIPLEQQNYSGHITTSLEFPLYLRNGMQFVRMGTDFTFNEDATGEGIGTFNDVEHVRYTFEGFGQGMQLQGFYTLLRENWGVEHPFSLFI